MAMTPRDVLAANRAAAAKVSTTIGGAKVRKLMAAAHAELVAKLVANTALGAKYKKDYSKTFGHTQMKATMAQIQDVVSATVIPGLEDVVLDTGMMAADYAAGGIVEYLESAEKMFMGVGAQPLALHEAAVLDAGQSGARSSMMRRLATSGTDAPGADLEESAAKMGILDRYGMSTIDSFEFTLQKGMLARKSMIEMRSDLIADSPFLQGKPEWWAQRIVRTEVAGAYNRASWESMREVDDQLGGDEMVKIISAVFDERTAADSYATHGQIRRLEEPFSTWYGEMMTPPDRSNDRGVVVPHRKHWPVPAYLRPRTPEEVMNRWHAEGRKTEMPEIPLISTVDLSNSEDGVQEEADQ